MKKFLKGILVYSNYDPVRFVDLDHKEEFYDVNLFQRLIIAKEVERSGIVHAHLVGLTPRGDDTDTFSRYDYGVVFTDDVDVVAAAFGRDPKELSALLLEAEAKEQE